MRRVKNKDQCPSTVKELFLRAIQRTDMGCLHEVEREESE
jgi:hypothetical protein